MLQCLGYCLVTGVFIMFMGGDSFISIINKKWLTADTYNNMDGWLVIIVEVLVVSTEG